MLGQDLIGGTQLEEVVVYDSLLPDYDAAGVAANVLSGEELSLWGIDSPQLLPETVPNFFSTDSGTRGFGDVMTMRGLTNTVFFGSPSVVYYVDGVPFGDVFSYADGIYGVDYVEVFRGPQGARFGKNSYGGVVNVRTVLPENEMGGRIGIRAGGYNRFGISGYAGGALVDDVLKFRLGASHMERDGYVDNIFLAVDSDPENQTAVSGALYWTPTDELEVTLSASYDYFNDGSSRLVSLIIPLDTYQVASDLRGQMKRESNTQALRIAYTHDDFDFTSVTAHRNWDLDPYVQDLDLTPLPLASSRIQQDQDQWSQEFRIASPLDADATADWTFGAFLASTKTNHDSLRSFFVFPPGITASLITDFSLDQLEYAFFAQGGIDVSEQWRVTGGLRYDMVEKKMIRTTANPFAAVPPFDLKDRWDMVSPSIGVEFEANENVLFYANTMYTFKPGGFSGFTDIPSLARFDSEENWASEIGVKANCLDDRMRTRLAAFYYKIDDYQVERTFSTLPMGPIPAIPTYLVVNADDAVSYGFEAELAFEVCPGFTLEGSFGYTNTELKTFADPLSGAILDGNTAPYVPEFDFAVAAIWECDCGFFSRVEYRGLGDTYFDDLNRAMFKQDSYGILNAQLGYRKDNFLVALYAANLTDEVYFTNKTADIFAGAPGEPRQFGVMVQLDF